MSFFKNVLGGLATTSRVVRREAGRRVQRGDKGFIPGLLGQAGRNAQKAARNKRRG